ncbi:alpha-L-fucosidase [Streptomyces sp. FIT100]|uniref:alpha-L-fucosidase n=1 Tax=Streptomyces sp. FIT100 TaxID=2837956 RepID=UPI0021C8A42E|nr:alpha-L-fucosidase [Streptomyces sp. FIT100]UUN30593.1 alpha-L-fucosidase [Streptomyces sp. FIT100]
MSTPSTPSTTWFNELGLGLFLHWGHASTRGWELSWQMTGGVHLQEPPLEPVTCREYFANAGSFRPERFDPAAWAELAWRAGARYVVFTAKHHDGFAMYDTKLSDYSVSKTWGRDVTAEVVDAFRARGFRIGLYFSYVDWHHEDYPRLTDDAVAKPYRVGVYRKGTPEQWAGFRAFMLGQLDELLTSYGDLDIVWLDGEFEYSAEEWGFGEIRELIRARQPGALVNDRCVGHGDFTTPEQQLPIMAPDGPWEACLTMNTTWGHVPSDDTWKTPTAILHTLVEAASMGGNLLLNVGPTGEGDFPPQAVERLEALAGWMERHAESIHGTEAGLELWQFHGPSTRRALAGGATRLYLHLTMRPYERITVRGMPVNRVRGVTLLGSGDPLVWTAHARLRDVHAASPDPTGELHIEIPSELLDGLCTVVAVDLAPAPAPASASASA